MTHTFNHYWLEQELPDSGWQRSEQFPILERHVVEWVDRANLKRVPINDYVLKITTEKLMSELSVISQEDYKDFVVSNGWINNLKQGKQGKQAKQWTEGLRPQLTHVPRRTSVAPSVIARGKFTEIGI